MSDWEFPYMCESQNKQVVSHNWSQILVVRYMLPDLAIFVEPSIKTLFPHVTREESSWNAPDVARFYIDGVTQNLMDGGSTYEYKLRTLINTLELFTRDND